MDLATSVKELWERRRWVALVCALAICAAVLAAYRVSLLPPSIEKRSLEFGAAETQILVDTSRSALADIRREFGPLTERAEVYSLFMTSTPVKRAIAREMRVPADALAAKASVADDNLPRSASEPDEGERASDLVTEGIRYRLTFEAEPDLPIVSVRAQAPTADDASRLAASAAPGLRASLLRVDARTDVPAPRQVRVVQLGRPRGELVNPGVNHAFAAVVLLGVLAVGCAAILVVANLGAGLRREPAAAGDAPDRAADGAEPTPIYVVGRGARRARRS